MPKVATCLWFGKDAEDAARLYVSLVPDSRIDGVWRTPADNPGGRAGEVMLVEFTLAGQKYQGLNGGQRVDYGHAASISVEATDQADVDRYWTALLDGGGKEVQCGWLTDRFGVPWQVVPKALNDVMRGEDAAAARRAFEAMMEMVKLDVARIEAAIRG